MAVAIRDRATHHRCSAGRVLTREVRRLAAPETGGTAMTDNPTQRQITVTTGEPFTPTWNRIPGIEVYGSRVSIDPDAYFYRYSAEPTWLLVDWDLVVDRLLGSEETQAGGVGQEGLGVVHWD